MGSTEFIEERFGPSHSHFCKDGKICDQSVVECDIGLRQKRYKVKEALRWQRPCVAMWEWSTRLGRDDESGPWEARYLLQDG